MKIRELDNLEKSNQLKEEACESCMELLKDDLTDEQLHKFVDIFDSVTRQYLFKEK